METFPRIALAQYPNDGAPATIKIPASEEPGFSNRFDNCLLNRLRKKCFILSFRAKQGISLRFKSNEREISRRKTRLGMTK